MCAAITLALVISGIHCSYQARAFSYDRGHTLRHRARAHSNIFQFAVVVCAYRIELLLNRGHRDDESGRRGPGASARGRAEAEAARYASSMA